METLSITILVYLIAALIYEVTSNGAGRPFVSTMEHFSCVRPSILTRHHYVTKTPGDNGFRIRVAGRPEPGHFKAESVYTGKREGVGGGELDLAWRWLSDGMVGRSANRSIPVFCGSQSCKWKKSRTDK